MLGGLLERLREWWRVDDEDRFEGSGEVILDPAYNERYRGERELQRLSEAAEETENRDDGR